MMAALHRHILQQVSGTAPDIVGLEPAASLTDSPTFGLRVAALFIILAGGFLGGVPPLVMRNVFGGQTVGCIVRALAGGVILALGLIHIAPEAIEDLAQLTEYPVGGVCIVGGVLLCLVLDAMLMALYASTNGASSGGRPCMHKRAAEACGAGGSSKTDVDVEASAKDAEMALSLPPSSDHSHGHNHTCLRASSATHQAAVSAMEEASASGDKQAAAVAAKKIAVAYTMEAGCIFHSVIIGLGLGVITEDHKLVVTLLIALIFHQALEGLALGSTIAVAQFSNLKAFTMLFAYSITAPLGVAIGIGLSAAYDPESTSALAAQGVLNGVSAGMLLYIALIELIGEEMTREDLQRRPGLKAAAYAALLLGAGSMALLAIWA